MYDLIVIGAGPAGLTSALYALRANKRVLIFESKCYGGQIVNASLIENYPGILNISGFDYATNLYNQVIKLGGIIKYEKVIKIDENKCVYTNKDKYNSKAIIIATGVENRKLGLDNEDKFVGRGLSYCATCDGNFYKDKTVGVIGGGNTALTDAIYLSNIVSKVYIIHRRDTFRGDERYVLDLKEKNNVEFVLNSNVVSINGEDILNSIDIKDNEDKITNLKLDGLFIAVGQQPNVDFLSDLINVDKYGYIESLDGVHTNIDGIYVAGDARGKELRQLVTAVSDGAIASTIAINELKSE